MKNILNTALFGAALMVAAAGFAQSSTSPQKGDEDRTPNSPASSSATSNSDTNSTSGTDSKATGSTSGTTGNAGATGSTGAYGSTGTYGTNGSTSGSSTMAPRSYSGTVKTIDAGRTLVITMANGRTQTFDISNSPALDSSVSVGSRVRVKQTVDASGHKVVTFEPYR